MRSKGGCMVVMRPDFTRRQALETSLLLALGAQYGTGAAAAEDGHDHDEDGPTLNRFATTVYGAEITGLHVTDDGRLFFNVQHPNADGDWSTVEPGIVGSVAGVDVHDLPEDFPSVQIPEETDGTLTEFDKRVHVAKGEYRGLAQGGEETDDGEPLGIPLTPEGEPLTDGKDPDFNGFVPHPENPDEGFLFTNWESQPGNMSRIHVRETASPGGWEVLGTQNVDFRDVQGTWNNCFGSVSPWNTPLTSEEYEPDAHDWFHSEETTYGAGDEAVTDYLGEPGNAYRYGYIVEIEDPAGDPTPVKHFSMGRFSHENSVVMPDRKTVYMSDDGTGTVFFKYVADRANDLSSGTLYAARAKQESGTNPAEVGFEIEWVELGHASDDEVEAWIAEYDQEPSTDPDYITDADVGAWANGEADDDRVAFLESRKAAAAKGATNEFRKLEGLNIPPHARTGDYLYMAMSEVNATMADDEGDIQLEGNDYGAVYRLPLERGYDVTRMEPVLVGGPETNVCGGCPYDAAPDSKSTVCQDCSYNPTTDADDEDEGLVSKGMAKLTSTSSTVDPENAIANPDNLVVLPDGRVIVGEDSDFHENNMLWVYSPAPDERGRGRRRGSARSEASD